MNLIKTLRNLLDRSFWNPKLFSTFGGRIYNSVAGVKVDQYSALNYSAVWAATNLYTKTISTMPVKLCMNMPDGKTPEAQYHPLNNLLKHEPCAFMGSTDFFSLMIADKLNWGNFFAFKFFDKDGRVREVVPIHPSRIPMENIAIVDGRLKYRVLTENGQSEIYDQKDIFHLMNGLTYNGIYGMGTIDAASESIGAALAAQQFGASFFGNNATPGLAVESTEMIDEEKEAQIKEFWKAYTGPSKGNKLMVLPNGLKIKPISVTPEASQFLETRHFDIAEIARWYNLPPHLLRDLTKSSFNNIESESIHFFILSLLPVITKIEKQMNRQLLGPKDRNKYFVKFNVDALLRGDSDARANFYQKLFAIGVFSQNDILALEDRDPIGPEGDQRYVMVNMQTLKQAKINEEKSAMELEHSKKTLEDRKNGVMDQVSNGDDPPRLDSPKGDQQDKRPKRIEEKKDDDAQEKMVNAMAQRHANGQIASLKAFQNILETTVQGMIEYECRALTQKARNPEKLSETLDGFYETVQEKVQQALEPLTEAATNLDIHFLPEKVSEAFCNQSKSEIKDMLNDKEFTTKFKEHLEIRKNLKCSQITNHIESAIQRRIEFLSDVELVT